MQWTQFDTTHEAIAVIGIAGRFPGAEQASRLWPVLAAGVSKIGRVPPGRWAQAATETQNAAMLDDVYHFDPLFFHLSPQDAAALDPQERLLLQAAWHALEDAGYDAQQLRGKAGAVWTAITKTGYELHGGAPDYLPVSSFAGLANRISHVLGLCGPSLPVDAMCASSLTALDLACQYLRRGEGEIALVGAVNLYLHPANFVRMRRNGLISPQASSELFGEGQGFVPGEAVAAVLLKPLALALEAGDHVYGCIRAAVSSHVGTAASMLAPNPVQQQACMQAALQEAGWDHHQISYVEVSANGAKLGDAAELRALQQVFAAPADAPPVHLGSIKPVLGHAEAAAGLTQLIKVLLQFQADTILPAGFSLPQTGTRLHSPQQALAWPAAKSSAQARRALLCNVSAGGMQSYLLLEDLPRADLPENKDSAFILPLSAKNAERLQAYAAALLNFLQDKDDSFPLRHMAAQYACGRSPMAARLAVVARDLAGLCNALHNFIQGRAWSGVGSSDGTAQATTAYQASGHARLDALAEQWLQGGNPDWRDHYREQHFHPQKLPGLPLYPFQARPCVLIRDLPAANAPAAMAAAEEEYENKAAEFYTRGVELASEEFCEEYLTFCPFPQEMPHFSQSLYFMNPQGDPAVLQMVQERQIEMRQVLFYKEDFAHIEQVLDFGCGHGTDVIRIAEMYPQLHTTGMTITRAQAELGNKRIASKGLSGRAKILHGDSSQYVFPALYDLIFGIEVSFHIRNKFGLFKNISSSLKPGGRLLLMDYFTNLRGAIVDPAIEVSIPTVKDWVDTLSTWGLLLDEWIDVSPQIANFLHDPEVEKHTAQQSEVVRKTLVSYANQAISLRQRWITYCLLKICKAEPAMSLEQRRKHNLAAFKRGLPYPQALAAMQAAGPAPYPAAYSASHAASHAATQSGARTPSFSHPV